MNKRYGTLREEDLDRTKDSLNYSTAATINETPLADSIIISKKGPRADLHFSTRKKQKQSTNQLYEESIHR
jgi:hypothetical protein